MIGGGHGRFHGGPEPSKARDTGKTLGRLFVYFKPYWPILLVVSTMLVISTLMQVTAPYLMGLAVDQFIDPQGRERPFWLDWIAPASLSRLAGLSRIMMILLVVYVVNWLANVFDQYMMTVMGNKVLLTMRTQILNRILALSLKFFDEHEAGDLMSRLVNDTQVIGMVFSNGIVRLASMSLNLIGIVISMVSLQWDMALVSFAILPVMIAATTIFANRARAAFRKTRKTIGDVSTELQENISGVREVQAFSRERENVAEFREINARNRDANVQAQTLTSAFSPALDVLSTVALAIVLGYGGWSVLRGMITVGIVVSFMTYVRRFYEPIQMISNLWTQLQSALAGAERIFELLDNPAEIEDAPDAVELPAVQGRVVFENVHFSYKSEEPVLQDVDIVAEPGQTVALVGPTGAGKTSTISLLMRFYDVKQGRITIDGYDTRQVTQNSLRRQMGMVLQDTFLFSGTVMENIRYGRLDATDEQVIGAASLANADPFINRLPNGYNTDIGERGHNLSQGQRQLISIARAILADPRILILDEATSSVDTRTEQLIQQALGQLLKGRTSFVIAHRLSTIRNADQVLVIEGGEIVERGTHVSLMEQRGRYYELYMSQFRREANVQAGAEIAGEAIPADDQGDGRRSAVAAAVA